MDKLFKQYMIQSLELLENQTVSQIRALKGIILAQEKNDEKPVSAVPRHENGFSPDSQQKEIESFEDQISKLMQDVAGVTIRGDDVDVSESAERDR